MRFELAEYYKRFIGSVYKWTGSGPYNLGFDCSGLILEGLMAYSLWGKEDASAQMIYNKFFLSAVMSERPDIGCLLFFGKSTKEITHIGYAINNYQYIEAGGGDSKSVDKGMVRIRPIAWRHDLVAVLQIFKE